MPINPNIALGVQPMQLQLPDPNANMNALARALQIKGAMAEGDLNAMRLDGLRRDTDRKNKMYSLLEQDYASPEEREGALLKGGYITEAGTLAKNRQDAAKAKADAEAKQVETAHKRYELAGQAMGWLRQNPTLENAQAALQYLVTTGGMPKDHADQAMARLQSNPAGVAQFADMVFRTALSAKDQLPTIQTRNTGGSTDTIAVDPVTQQARVVNSVQNTQSPDSVASVAEQRRAHDMADFRAREQFQGAEQQFTPAAIDNAAARYNIDGTLPPMGMGKAGAMGRSAILNRAAELAAGVDPQQQRITQIGNKANTAALSKIQQQQTMVGAFEKNFNKNADIALELSQKVDRTGIPLANKWINAGKRSIAGDPDLAAFDQAIKSASNEYAKIISGSMGNTAVAEGEIKKVEALLNSAQTPQQVSAVLSLMKRETANRMAGFEEEKATLRASMTGKPPAHEPPAAAGLPSGWSVKVK